jgi:hypothetical protein
MAFWGLYIMREYLFNLRESIFMQIEILDNLKAPLNAIKQHPIRFLILVLVSIILGLAAILIPILIIRGARFVS